MNSNHSRFFGNLIVLIGVGMILVGTGVIPVEQREGDSFFGLAVAGFVFASGGFVVLFHQYPQISMLFSICTVAGMTTLSAWVAFAADPVHFESVPLALISEKWNLIVCRGLFGAATLLLLILLAVMILRLFKKKETEKWDRKKFEKWRRRV